MSYLCITYFSPCVTVQDAFIQHHNNYDVKCVFYSASWVAVGELINIWYKLFVLVRRDAKLPQAPKGDSASKLLKTCSTQLQKSETLETKANKRHSSNNPHSKCTLFSFWTESSCVHFSILGPSWLCTTCWAFYILGKTELAQKNNAWLLLWLPFSA